MAGAINVDSFHAELMEAQKTSNMSDIGEGISKLSIHDDGPGAPVPGPTTVKEARDEQRQELFDTIQAAGWGKIAAGVLPQPGAAWASSAQRYEWQDEYGVVAPPMPELEKQLFDHELIMRAGANFDGLDIAVTVESEEQVAPILKFADAGLHPVMLENVKLCRYERPTPIQSYCIPALLTGHDVIAVAQTGSGKTAAFLIPILSKLMGKAAKLRAPRPSVAADFTPRTQGVVAEPLVLIICPTRELSIQTFDEARRLCYRSMLRPCVAYGGGPRRDQMDELRKGCDILIGTPGRLIDFIQHGNLIKLKRVKYTVIDEADELVAPDWLEDMQRILDNSDFNEEADHNYLLFSATFPSEARRLAKQYLAGNHIRVRVGRMGSSHKNIAQTIVKTSPATKDEALKQVILRLPATRTLVFANRKETADLVDDFLHHLGFPSTSIHSDRPQREREDALQAFKAGTSPILVATAVSARGLDVSHVMHVVNYDMPYSRDGPQKAIAEYVHRIGRTARIGNKGCSTSLFTERDEDLAPLLVKLLRETDQPVPDFLDEFAPAEGEDLDFEDASDEEPAEGENGEGGGESWGGNGGDNAGDGSGGNDAVNDDGIWGTSKDAAKEEVAAGW